MPSPWFGTSTRCGQTISRADTYAARCLRRFQNLPAAGPHGTRSNYVQVLFEMIDLDSGELVWTGMYEFKKSHREAIMYR